MFRILSMVIPMLASTQAWAQDCDNYGQISPEEVDAYSGSEVTFYIRAANNGSCGDPTNCDWILEDDPELYGTLDSDIGSPVIWTAPDVIDDCSGYSVQLLAQCSDAADVGSAYITLYCDEEDKEASLEQSRNTTVQGGGCGSTASTAGFFFLPLFFLGWRRR